MGGGGGGGVGGGGPGLCMGVPQYVPILLERRSEIN